MSVTDREPIRRCDRGADPGFGVTHGAFHVLPGDHRRTYEEAWAKSAWAAKAIPQIEWEPNQASLESINAGRDTYITQFAQGVRRANVPMTMSLRTR